LAVNPVFEPVIAPVLEFKVRLPGSAAVLLYVIVPAKGVKAVTAEIEVLTEAEFALNDPIVVLALIKSIPPPHASF
jgi:hypothetical protein